MSFQKGNKSIFPSLNNAFASNAITAKSPRNATVMADPWRAESRVARSKPTPQVISPYAMRKTEMLRLIPTELLKQAAECTTDPHWSNVLLNSSKGKWPRGFRFRDGALTYQGKKAGVLHIGNQSPEETSLKFIEFIKSRSGQRSRADELHDERIFDDTLVASPTDEKNDKKFWTIMRARDAYISSYVELKSTSVKLGATARARLFSYIYFAIGMSWIDPKTFKFEKQGNRVVLVDIPNLEITGPRFTDWHIKMPGKKAVKREPVPLIPYTDATTLFDKPVDVGELERVLHKMANKHYA